MLDETNRRDKMRRFKKNCGLDKANYLPSAIRGGVYERSDSRRKRMYGTAVFKYLPEIWM